MNEAGAPGSTRAAERTAWQTMARRRRRVWRNLALIVVMTGVMVVLAMAERDHQALRGEIARCRERLEYAAAQLQAARVQRRPVPRTMPLPPEEVEIPENASPAERERLEDARLDLLLRYVYVAQHRRQAGEGRPVPVCYCARPHHLYMSENIRHVIVFDGQAYQLQTMKESEFQRRWPEMAEAGRRAGRRQP